MKTKKFRNLFLVMAMVFCLTAFGYYSESRASSGDVVTLVCGNVATGDTNPYNMCMRWAADYLKEKNSTVRLNLQLQGVLGSETEQCQQVILGNQDVVQTADMSTTNFFPKMAFANFPMLFENYDDVYKNWSQDGWAFKTASKILAEGGLVLLGASDNGFRIVTNSKHEVTSIADLAGMKIRVPEVALLLDIWKQFGVQTAPIAFAELPTALQQGTVDGQELGVQHFYSNRWDEFNKYMTQTNYDYSAFLIYINKERFDGLNKQQQKDLMDAFGYACNKTLNYAVEFNKKGLEEMIKDGLLLTDMNDTFRDEIYKIGYDLAHTPKWMNILGKDLVEQMYPNATR